MKPASMKNIVLILILTVFGVGPSFAAPRRYPGKFPPKIITPGSYHHHEPETGRRPRPPPPTNSSTEVNTTLSN